MSEKHTSGRLSADLGNGGNVHKLRTEDGHILAYVEQITRIDTSAADALRLVACWNACNGYSTEELENMAQDPHGMRTYSHEVVRSVAEQRDELLVVLKEISSMDGANARAIASSAIAKATGRAA